MGGSCWAGGAGLASVAYGRPRVAFGEQRAETQTITLTATAAHLGQYRYLPLAKNSDRSSP